MSSSSDFSLPAEEKPQAGLGVRVQAKARQAPAEDVVDLLSSGDEAEGLDEEDEAATLHGEISPVSRLRQIRISNLARCMWSLRPLFLHCLNCRGFRKCLS